MLMKALLLYNEVSLYPVEQRQPSFVQLFQKTTRFPCAFFSCSFLYPHFVFDLYCPRSVKLRYALLVYNNVLLSGYHGSVHNVQLRLIGSRGQHLVGLQRLSLLLLLIFASEIIPDPAASKLQPVFLNLALGSRHYLFMFRVYVR